MLITRPLLHPPSTPTGAFSNPPVACNADIDVGLSQSPPEFLARAQLSKYPGVYACCATAHNYSCAA